MKLYGSTTSPYVRRLRLWLANDDYEFVTLNVFDPEGRKLLSGKTPIMKVPVLVDGEQVIYDSGLILRYLSQQWDREPLSWQQENTLVTINAANDSFIELFLLAGDGINVKTPDLKLAKMQKDRTDRLMKLFEAQIKAGEFAQWDYLTMSLFSLLDWLMFRNVFDFTGFEHLQAFVARHADRAEVKATDPR